MPADANTVRMRSRAELEELQPRLAHRVAYEGLIADSNRAREAWTMPGYCEACDAAATFDVDWTASYANQVNFRERVICPGCGLNSRQRHIAGETRRLATAGARIYMNEQITPFYRWAREALQCELVGSEFVDAALAPGSVRDGIRHEDSAALSFEDASFDAIVSQDVFEHVPDIVSSLRECARVLRPGGRLLFSIPFHYYTDETVRRAELRDGAVVELAEPQYHDNPVDLEGGSLVFYDHGWDILDAMREAGFADAYVLGYWSALYGYLGQGIQFALVGEKP